MNKTKDQRLKTKDLLIRLTVYGLLLTAYCLLLVAPAAAKTGFDLGTAGTGARPMGMGRAFTAVSDDVNALFANPAGLGVQKTWGLTSMSTKLLGRVEYRMAGGTYPTRYGTLGVGYLSMLTPAGYLTTEKKSLATAEMLNYGSTQLSLSYGVDLAEIIKGSRSLGNLSFGATYKITSSKFEGYDAAGNGSGLDMGVLFRPNSILSGGLTFQNVGGAVGWKNGTKEDLPLVNRLGGAINLEKVRIAVDLDSAVHGGIEYRPLEGITLRAGLDNQDLTGGVGVNFSGFSFDYAYRKDSALLENSTHYFSISYQPETMDDGRRTMEEKKDEASIVIETTDGVYRLSSKRISEKSILRYYE